MGTMISQRVFEDVPSPIMKRIFEVFDEDGDGEISFEEIARGMMHFKWNDKVHDNKSEWLLSTHFQKICCKMMDVEGVGKISKLCLYTVLGRMEREDAYQLSDAIFEVISPNLISVSTKELVARLALGP